MKVGLMRVKWPQGVPGTLRDISVPKASRVKAREEELSHSYNAQGTFKMRNFPLQMSLRRGRGV